MSIIRPLFDRIWYGAETFRIASAVRVILRACLLLVGLTITIVVFVGGHVVKLIIAHPN